VFSSYTYITTSGVPQGVGGLRGDPTNTTRFQELRGGLPDFLASHYPAVNGCTHAWSRKLFDYFGPIRTDWEDLVLSFRTLVAGKMIYIQEPLVKYRRHDNNVSFFAEQDDTRSFEHRERRLRWVDEQGVRAYDTMIADIDTARQKGAIKADMAAALKRQAKRLQKVYAVERGLMEGSMASRWLILARTAGEGHTRLAARFLPRALPYPLYRREERIGRISCTFALGGAGRNVA
jgi:hypothetical protein